MNYRNGNYSAFYVNEPFHTNNLKALSAKDFVYYRLLRMWKRKDQSFPFNDSHDKTYNVRDGSDWESTLKPRLRERLNKSKNMILFLSSLTKNSRALREEIDYGINVKELPVIVVYPEYSENKDIIDCKNEELKKKIVSLWDRLPIFRDSMGKVATIHIPNKKLLIEKALRDKDLMVATQKVGRYFYPC